MLQIQLLPAGLGFTYTIFPCLCCLKLFREWILNHVRPTSYGMPFRWHCEIGSALLFMWKENLWMSNKEAEKDASWNSREEIRKEMEMYCVLRSWLLGNVRYGRLPRWNRSVCNDQEVKKGQGKRVMTWKGKLKATVI